ncbi:MAG: hypothetical protein H8E57_08700 [Candidatus Cloacimonetes bacterium]|nr:hypothetical protein [Candidatus Cloacimonadota bacterium]
MLNSCDDILNCRKEIIDQFYEIYDDQITNIIRDITLDNGSTDIIRDSSEIEDDNYEIEDVGADTVDIS